MTIRRIIGGAVACMVVAATGVGLSAGPAQAKPKSCGTYHQIISSDIDSADHYLSIGDWANWLRADSTLRDDMGMATVDGCYWLGHVNRHGV